MSVAELRPPRALWRTIHRLEDDQTLDGATRVVERGAGVAGRGGVGSVLRGEWLGHALHPLLSDLPLGCWTAAAVLDLTARRRSRFAARRLIGMGLLFAAPTAAAGLADFGTLTDQRSRRVAAVHAAGNAAAMGLYLASWRARRHGHHLVGTAASTLGGVVAIGSGYLGGHLSFVLGAASGERGRISAAIALPEHAGEPQSTTSAVGDVGSQNGRPGASTAEDPQRPAPSARPAPVNRRPTATDDRPTIEVLTPVVTDDQHAELRQLPHVMAVTGSDRLTPKSDEMRTAFQFPPGELTLDNLRALSAEASRIAGSARLLYRGDDPNVTQLVERANSG